MCNALRICPSCGGGLAKSDPDGATCWSCRYIGRVLGQAPKESGAQMPPISDPAKEAAGPVNIHVDIENAREALERPAARERQVASGPASAAKRTGDDGSDNLPEPSRPQVRDIVLGRALEALERPAARERQSEAGRVVGSGQASDNLPEASRPQVRDIVGAAVEDAAGPVNFNVEIENARGEPEGGLFDNSDVGITDAICGNPQIAERPELFNAEKLEAA
jgi:hypothetical protein